MKKIESVLYKVSTGGLIALVPFIQYWSSTSNIANATIPNDVLDFSNAEVSKYIKFQSSDPLFNYTTYQNSNNSRNLTIDELADLSIGIRITNQTTFESAFNGGYGDEHGDVKLDTLIYSLNCVDNSIDIGLTPRDTNTNILLNYVNSSWFDLFRQDHTFKEYSEYSTGMWVWFMASDDAYYLGKNLSYVGPSTEMPPAIGTIKGGVYESVAASSSNSFSITPSDHIEYVGGTPLESKPIHFYRLIAQYEGVSQTAYRGDIVSYLDTIQFQLQPKNISANWNNMIKIHKYSASKYAAYLAYDADLKITIPFRISGHAHVDWSKHYSYGPINEDLGYSDTFYSTVSLSPYLHGIS